MTQMNHERIHFETSRLYMYAFPHFMRLIIARESCIFSVSLTHLSQFFVHGIGKNVRWTFGWPKVSRLHRPTPVTSFRFVDGFHESLSFTSIIALRVHG